MRKKQCDHSIKAKSGRLTLAVENKTSWSLGFLGEVRHPPAGTVTPEKTNEAITDILL